MTTNSEDHWTHLSTPRFSFGENLMNYIILMIAVIKSEDKKYDKCQVKFILFHISSIDIDRYAVVLTQET